jgi:hypothetical protein
MEEVYNVLSTLHRALRKDITTLKHYSKITHQRKFSSDHPK